MILLNILNGKHFDQTRIPLWFMRQAGRTLPEYRALRKTSESFWDMCFVPKLTVEATLQPIRRFDIDAAILFSDILTVPKALGQKIIFEEGVGPVCDTSFLQNLPDLCASSFQDATETIMLSIGEIRSHLTPQQTLIGFAGGPFTVANYMIEGRKTKTHIPFKTFIYQNPDAFQQLLDLLVEATILYLKNQIQAGVQVIQLFESWADVIGYQEFDRYVFSPMIRIAQELRRYAPQVPLIVFPRGAYLQYEAYFKTNLFAGLNLDHQVCFETLARTTPDSITLQGGIDPAKVIVGGEVLRKTIHETLDTFRRRRYIGNLSHGLDPTTPVENIEFFVNCFRNPNDS